MKKAEQVVLADLKTVEEKIAELVTRNLKTSPPDLVGYWADRFIESRDEVARLKCAQKS